jgi:TM2 domain-containing membrane protein YozV
VTDLPPSGEWYRPPAPRRPEPQQHHLYQQPPAYQQPWPPSGPVLPPHLSPYSDKSKVTAGLLQLLLGFFLGIGGVGRLYAGHTNLGVAQLVLGIVAWTGLICLWWMIVPIFFFVGIWLWFVIDGIMLLTGNPVDVYGRPLRS